jgi:hypothetical protein
VIQAEKEFDEAIETAKKLGEILNEIEQESGFISRSDDGYHESVTDQLIAHVDRNRIHRWMNGLEDNVEQLPKSLSDEWNSRNVEMCDSVSITFQVRRERQRIDRWRATCDREKSR